MYLGVSNGPAVRVETTHRLSRSWPVRENRDVTPTATVAHDVVRGRSGCELYWRVLSSLWRLLLVCCIRKIRSGVPCRKSLESKCCINLLRTQPRTHTLLFLRVTRSTGGVYWTFPEKRSSAQLRKSLSTRRNTLQSPHTTQTAQWLRSRNTWNTWP